jgi:hypothetical protein
MTEYEVSALENACARVREREMPRTPDLMAWACQLGDARLHSFEDTPLVVRAQRALTSIVAFPLAR